MMHRTTIFFVLCLLPFATSRTVRESNLPNIVSSSAPFDHATCIIALSQNHNCLSTLTIRSNDLRAARIDAARFEVLETGNCIQDALFGSVNVTVRQLFVLPLLGSKLTSANPEHGLLVADTRTPGTNQQIVHFLPVAALFAGHVVDTTARQYTTFDLFDVDRTAVPDGVIWSLVGLVEKPDDPADPQLQFVVLLPASGDNLKMCIRSISTAVLLSATREPLYDTRCSSKPRLSRTSYSNYRIYTVRMPEYHQSLLTYVLADSSGATHDNDLNVWVYYDTRFVGLATFPKCLTCVGILPLQRLSWDGDNEGRESTGSTATTTNTNTATMTTTRRTTRKTKTPSPYYRDEVWALQFVDSNNETMLSIWTVTRIALYALFVTRVTAPGHNNVSPSQLRPNEDKIETSVKYLVENENTLPAVHNFLRDNLLPHERFRRALMLVIVSFRLYGSTIILLGAQRDVFCTDEPRRNLSVFETCTTGLLLTDYNGSNENQWLDISESYTFPYDIRHLLPHDDATTLVPVVRYDIIRKQYNLVSKTWPAYRRALHFMSPYGHLLDLYSAGWWTVPCAVSRATGATGQTGPAGQTSASSDYSSPMENTTGHTFSTSNAIDKRINRKVSTAVIVIAALLIASVMFALFFTVVYVWYAKQ